MTRDRYTKCPEVCQLHSVAMYVNYISPQAFRFLVQSTDRDIGKTSIAVRQRAMDYTPYAFEYDKEVVNLAGSWAIAFLRTPRYCRSLIIQWLLVSQIHPRLLWEV